MLYSALNLRPYLEAGGDWYHIAIGYYNIILPSFLPSTISPAEAFWYRASVVRKQTNEVVKSKWMASRAKLMALERERRAAGFEREDERRRIEKRAEESGEGLGKALMGLGIGFGGEAPKTVVPEVEKLEKNFEEKKKVVVPSTALMGLSMLGSELCCLQLPSSQKLTDLHTQILMECTPTRTTMAYNCTRQCRFPLLLFRGFR